MDEGMPWLRYWSNWSFPLGGTPLLPCTDLHSAQGNWRKTNLLLIFQVPTIGRLVLWLKMGFMREGLGSLVYIFSIAERLSQCIWISCCSNIHSQLIVRACHLASPRRYPKRLGNESQTATSRQSAQATEGIIHLHREDVLGMSCCMCTWKQIHAWDPEARDENIS